MGIDTKSMKDNILSQKSAKDLMNYINHNTDLFIDWKTYINEIVGLFGHSYEAFAKATGFSRSTVRNWCINGTLPKSRDAFIKLSFGLKMDLEQTNELISKYGKYSKLYAKDIYDAITIYIINKRTNNWNNKNYQYDSLNKWIEKYKNFKTVGFKTNHSLFAPKTMSVYNNILDIQDDYDFEIFLDENKSIFLTSYSRLISYIEDFIRIRNYEMSDVLNEKAFENYSWHRIIKEKNLVPYFEKIWSNLKIQGILPSRRHLIAFGIHLNMTAEDIDKMLSLAHMEKLYAKDKVESVLLYFLRHAVKTDPDLELNNAYKYIALSSSKEFIKEYRDIINKYIGKSDIPEWNECIDDLTEYIRNKLLDLKLNEYIDSIL